MTEMPVLLVAFLFSVGSALEERAWRFLLLLSFYVRRLIDENALPSLTTFTDFPGSDEPISKASGYTCNFGSTNKRGRKKKTFAELKEEESSLLKERKYLKKEIATINTTFEVVRTKNESLKRMKFDLGSKSRGSPSSTRVELQDTVAGQPHQRVVPSEARTRTTQDDTRSQASESRSTGESFCLIPDLNMMPSDEGSCTDALYGLS